MAVLARAASALCFLTNGTSGIKQQAVWRGVLWTCLCVRETNWVLGFEISPSPLWRTSHLDGSNLGSRPHPSLFCHWKAFPGLGFSFRFLVSIKLCHDFWPCSPLRFLWGNGNVTKLLGATFVFQSWKLGPIFYTSYSELECFVPVPKVGRGHIFVTLVTTINSLCEVTAHPDDGLLGVFVLFCFWMGFCCCFCHLFLDFFFFFWFGFSIHLLVYLFVSLLSFFSFSFSVQINTSKQC